MVDDGAGFGEPDAVGARVLDDVFEDPAELRHSIGLAENEGVQRQRVDQRLLLALLQHLVDLVGHHLGELARRVVAVEKRRRIVELHRVGHRQDRPELRLHPHRLVVERPVEHVAVAGLLEMVERRPGLGYPRAEPAAGLHPLLLDQRLRRLLDEHPLLVLRQIALALRVGAAVADHLVAARADALHDLRRVVVDRRVDQVAGGKAELVEQVEHAPDADPEPVVAPSVVADVGLRPGSGRGVAHPLAVAEMLDVEADIEGEPLAVRPVVLRAVDDRGVVVAAVHADFHEVPRQAMRGRRYTRAQASGTTAVASISTLARSSISAETSTAAIAG